MRHCLDWKKAQSFLIIFSAYTTRLLATRSVLSMIIAQKCLLACAVLPRIGCASNLSNLVVNDVMNDLEDVFRAIVKLKGLLLSAKLCELTVMSPKRRNSKIWISSFEIW